MESLIVKERKEQINDCINVTIKVADYFGLEHGNFLFKSRNNIVMLARKFAAFYLYKTGIPQGIISDVLQRDRTTIVYYIQDISGQLEVDKRIKDEYAALRKFLKSYEG